MKKIFIVLLCVAFGRTIQILPMQTDKLEQTNVMAMLHPHEVEIMLNSEFDKIFKDPNASLDKKVKALNPSIMRYPDSIDLFMDRLREREDFVSARQILFTSFMGEKRSKDRLKVLSKIIADDFSVNFLYKMPLPGNVLISPIHAAAMDADKELIKFLRDNHADLSLRITYIYYVTPLEIYQLFMRLLGGVLQQAIPEDDYYEIVGLLTPPANT